MLQSSLFEDLPENPQKISENQRIHSNYVVYVDESGDHGVEKLDDQYPVFVLAFCIFHKRNYCETVIPSIEKFKFNYFGHDHIILHEHEIRKSKGAFSFLITRELKECFISDLTSIISLNNFIIASCVVDKSRLREKYPKPANPYNIALSHCIETLHQLLEEKGQSHLKTHVVFECRGDKEDKDLELEFRRICDGENKFKRNLSLEIIFANKKVNSSGLQLADLIARPIGINYLRPNQNNRAYEVIKKKFFAKGGRKNAGKIYEEHGMKVFPTP